MNSTRSGDFEVNSALARFREGDNSAFDTLISLFRPLMVSMTNRFCPDPASSEWEEWFQEARIALYRAAVRYRTDSDRITFGLFARICIRNAFIDRERRKNVDTVPLSQWQEDALLFSNAVDPLEVLVKSEERKNLRRRIVSLLSPYELKVFDGMLDGLTVSEIAKSAGKTEKSVSNAVFRLTGKLYHALHNN